MSETWEHGSSFGTDSNGQPGGLRWPWRRWPSRREDDVPEAGYRPWDGEAAVEDSDGVPPFTPRQIDKDSERRWVKVQIGELPRHAVDQTHGHLLDGQIDDKADQWAAQVRREFENYAGWLRRLRGQADADVLHKEHMQKEYDQRVAETLAARTSAASQLTGEDDEGKYYQPGHSDPAALSGKSSASWIYLGALAFAGIADLIAFYQVLELLFSRLDGRAIFVFTLGFTILALMLANYLGILLRDRVAGTRMQHPVHLILVAVGWAGLGLAAFWVRLDINSLTSSSAAPGAIAVPGASGNAQGTLPGATLFAIFYLASGAVAMTGSYFNHNPLRRAFIKAVEAHDKALRAQADAAGNLAAAKAERDAIGHQEEAATKVRDLTIEELQKLAAELQKLARIELIKKLGSASRTDGLLHGLPGRKPTPGSPA
jgi:hypothetical protein